MDMQRLENRSDTKGARSDTESARSATQNHVQRRILEFLENGEKRTNEIMAACGAKQYVRQMLTALVRTGEIVRVKQGLYRLGGAPETVRTEAENAATIDRLLDLYDKVLESYIASVEPCLGAGGGIEDFLGDFKTLALIVDRLMKRWYLVHRGYDNNTQQAQEDVKQKVAERLRERLKDAPVEDQVVKVGHFHEKMKVLWENLPDAEKERRTV